MSDRKYRQRGYQDEPRRPQGPRPEAKAPEQRAPGRQLQDAAGPKTPNLMASHEVFRCSRCGNRLSLPVGGGEQCSKCSVDLHSCIQCSSFDTSARFECSDSRQTARVSTKDARNTCEFFTAKTTIERRTSTDSAPPSARQAFDDLFK